MNTDKIKNTIALQPDGTMLEYLEHEIVVSSESTGEIMEWVNVHDIQADLLGSWWSSAAGRKNAWGIKNEDHRMTFVLRWA